MFYNIPSNKDEGLFIFPGTRSSGTNEWRSWTIPSSAEYISMIVIGPGGNGGLGRAAANGVAKGGGGGGGSGGITKAIFRTRTLPSTLFLNFSTSETTISVEPSSTNSLYSKIIFALGGGNGGTATGTADAAGGTAAVSATNITVGPPPFLASALGYHALAGVAGAAGSTSITSFMLAGAIGITGGCGGSATAATPTFGTGGSITNNSIEYFPSVAGGTGNASGKGNDGGHGYWFWKPHLCGMGGGGGGAGNGLPGIGGNGGYGCGGGGGGSCVTADPNAGGQGGPGLIILKCF